MTAFFEALQTVEYVAFGLLGALAVAHWRRRPSPATGWLAATLSSLAVVMLAAAFLPEELDHPALLWTGKLLLVVLATFPYLLFKFMSTFIRQPRWLNRSAAGMTAAVAAASLLLPEFPDPTDPLPPLFVGYLALFLVNWILLSSVVAVRLWQGGRGQPGVARRRMRTLSLGTVGLAIAILVAGVSPNEEAITPATVAVHLIILGTAPSFLLGFAPPRLIRMAWRRREELAMRSAELELMKAMDPKAIAATLLPSMCALVGGNRAVMYDAAGTIVGVHVIRSGDPAPANGGNSGTALTVKLGSGSIVVHASPFTPFFGSEEAQILQSLGVLADLALARAELFQAEQRKNAYLRILQQVTASANTSGGPHAAIQSALDTVCAETGWQAGHAYMLHETGRPDPAPSWQLAASSHRSEDRPAGAEPVESAAAGGGAVGRVFATGESLWVPDRAGDAPPTGRESAQAGAAGVVPIRVGPQVVGVLEFISGTAREPDPEFLDVLTQIGVQLGRAVERAHSQEQLRRRADDLARSNTDLEQFAYVASHDLQEPLRMVSSYMQLLSERYEDALDETGQRYVRYAVDGATRMQSLVRDLLSFSRVGSRGCEPVPADMNRILEQTLADFDMAIKECGAVVIADHLPQVIGDPAQLTQLLQNLVGNAIKFRGDSRPEVGIHAEWRGGEWLFSVTDNGVGFDPKYAERAFVIFKRLHNREDYPGTGIGLAISKKIVERHGGRIWAESETGRGTTIFFTLPAAHQAAA